MGKIRIKTFSPGEKIPEGVILPKQTHSTRIVEVFGSGDDLKKTDGIYTRNPHLLLGVKTADCAPIALVEDGQFGILHAGWRGLVNGIIENMLTHFNQPEIYVGPFLFDFEIQMDDCYHAIKKRFGTTFFIERDSKIFFDFLGAISEIIPSATFDHRSTFHDKKLASWRRDRSNRSNCTIIGGW